MSKLTPCELQAAKWHYEHYHNSIVSNPDLYAYDGRLTIRMMDGLRSRCNAAAGHDGLPGNYRAIGISMTTSDPRKELAKIYASFESFVRFIESSDCRGLAETDEANAKSGIYTPPSFEEARLAIGMAQRDGMIKLNPRDTKFIRDTLAGHLPYYRNTEDAVRHIADIAAVL